MQKKIELPESFSLYEYLSTRNVNDFKKMRETANSELEKDFYFQLEGLFDSIMQKKIIKENKF